ncbi:hypothetical protein [Opitutus sp. ER46]|uniref:hypothetical protein n=1 Tax=Opitutus sp. ER46 TaxID=2161864 RepID=UPI0018EEC011|nr:hypothetical protein [Opitutus sp. ER46]
MNKAIQFGAGNIGRGFIGLVLEHAGYRVIFADINQEMVDRLNRDRCYTVHVLEPQVASEKKAEHGREGL